MKIIYIVFIFLIVGCYENVDYREVPFVYMDAEVVQHKEQKALCDREKESIFCTNSISIGDIKPTKEYAIQVLKEMNKNFKYKIDDTWHYNDTIYEELIGDCEDIASTMAKHMVDDGIGKEYLYLVYRKISETESHMFLAVDTTDAGLLHVDYSNSGYPIEDTINFYMALDDVGIDKWIKGNIR